MAVSKILVVDGDAASRNYVSAALHQDGYEVLTAPSGADGLVAAWRDRPDLIVVDPGLPDMTGEDLASRLRADARTRATFLIALSTDSSLPRRQSCLQAGYSEYIVKSQHAIDLLRDGAARMFRRGTAGKPHALSIVFLSAKGGTGTSSLCANIAMNIAEARPNLRIALADLVLPIGSIAAIVGSEGGHNLVTFAELPAATTTPDYLRQALTHNEEWRFDLMPGSPDPEHANLLNVARIDELICGLKNAYDLVVLDLGRSLSRISLPLIQQADVVAMVVASDVGTVTLSKTVWDYLCGKGVTPPSVFVILNRAVGLEGPTKAEIEKTLGLPVKTTLPYLSGNLSLANNQHHPYCVKYPADTASIVLREAATQVMTLAQSIHAA